ncbi:hypothetical protein KY308_01835 [Candidatus Woesearchaeota archaeon]|nr:hypothetical protein [Candidatus Woesearchaeota archaeon]
MAHSPIPEDFDVEAAESETISRVNKTLSAIEKAVAAWDASEEKPLTLRLKIMHLKRFHSQLSKWEKKMLLSISRHEARGKRVILLREFTEICHTYA